MERPSPGVHPAGAAGRAAHLPLLRNGLRPEGLSLTLWRVVDGKPGHERQSEGLARALARRCAVAVHDIAAPPARAALGWWLAGAFPPGEGLPDPDLIVGAGHATHAALLAARRARGGRAVVLMRPSLPLAWFDLCVVPEHDRPPARPNVLVTRGPLNPLRPASRRGEEGIVLVGGPSAHHGWDGAAALAAIGEVLAREPDRPWTVTTSRRTPAGFAEAARAALAGRARVVPWQETDPGWLPERLARAAVAWVTEDSASMVYEALSAGAAVGLLPVPRRGRAGRVVRGIDGLVAAGLAVRLVDWLAGAVLRPPAEPLDEAGRCAEWILARWFGA